MIDPSMPRHRYTYLDGVRGWAALMVALSHFVLALHPALLGGGEKVAHFAASVAIGRTPLIALYNPQLGVAIFFVLSGFVLASSVADRPAWFPELAVRRWLRLAVPILGTSLLIWPLARFRLFFNTEAAPIALSDWMSGHYGWLAFAYPDLLGLVTQSLFDIFARANHWYNPALWTMPTEFWGSMGLFAAYALLPGIFAAAEGGVFLGALAVALLWKTQFAGFAYGVLLFETMRMLPRLPGALRHALAATQPWAGYAVLALGIALGGMPYSLDLANPGIYGRLFLLLGPHVAKPVELLHDLGAMLIVGGVLLCRPAQRFLDARFCQYLGRVSFMLYLVHVPILCSLIAWLLLRFAPVVGYNLLSAGLLVLFLGVVFLLADITTRCIDAPSIGLSRRAGQAVTRRLRPLLPDILPALRRQLTAARCDRPPVHRPPVHWAWRAGLVAVFAALVISRIPAVFTQGRFWAEEGFIYFRAAWHSPWPDALFIVHTGYLNLAASSATLLAAIVTDLRHAPLLTAAVATIFQVIPAILLMVSGIPWLRSLPALAIGLLALLTPLNTTEVWVNSITSQFHLALAAGIVLASDARGGRVGVLQKAVLLFAPLAGPLAGTLTPLFVARAVIDRSWPRLFQALLLAVPTAVQALMVLTHPEPSRSLGLPPTLLAAVLTVQQVLLPLLGSTGTRAIAEAAIASFRAGIAPMRVILGGVAAFVVFAAALWLRRDTAAWWLFAAGVWLAVAAFSAALTLDDPLYLLVWIGTRYSHVPSVLFALSLLGLASARPLLARAVPAVLLAWVIGLGLSEYWNVPGYFAAGAAWPREVAAWQADPAHWLAIWPDGWRMPLAPRQ